MTHLKITNVSPEESSFIRGIIFDPERNLMEVRLQRDGSEMPYYYPNVSQSFYNRFISAKSYGTFYTNNIKSDSYRQREYVEEFPELTLTKDKFGTYPKEFYTLVSEKCPAIVQQYSDVFEAIRKRQYDIELFNIDGFEDQIRLAHYFRLKLVMYAYSILEDNSVSNPVLNDCQTIIKNIKSVDSSVAIGETLK